MEELRFEQELQQSSTYRRTLPAALAGARGCRVLESHGDQVMLVSPLRFPQCSSCHYSSRVQLLCNAAFVPQQAQGCHMLRLLPARR